MRRELDLDWEPTELALSPPDRSQLREMFRRFEFRNLLGRVDELDEAVPAAPMLRVEGTTVAWHEGALPPVAEWEGYAADDGRIAVATPTGVVVAPKPSTSLLLGRASACRPRREVAQGARGRRHDDRGVPDRAGSRRVRARRPQRRVRARGRARSCRRGGDRRARPPRRGAAPADRADARTGARARLRAPLPRDRAAAHGRARGDGVRRRQDRHLPHGRDHRPARRPARGAGGQGLRARRRGVHARLDPAGRADPLREARADPGSQGQDRLLDRHARPPLDPRRPPDRGRSSRSGGSSRS